MWIVDPSEQLASCWRLVISPADTMCVMIAHSLDEQSVQLQHSEARLQALSRKLSELHNLDSAKVRSCW